MARRIDTGRRSCDAYGMADPVWVINEPEAMRFRVNRSTLVDPQVLELERRRIFDICWIYVGHESEVRAPGDFKTRIVCDRPVTSARAALFGW